MIVNGYRYPDGPDTDPIDRDDFTSTVDGAAAHAARYADPDDGPTLADVADDAAWADDDDDTGDWDDIADTDAWADWADTDGAMVPDGAAHWGPAPF